MRKRSTGDEIGRWSEVRLQIIKEYASAYSRILSKQPRMHHVYIDGFSGKGWHRARGTERFVKGSPLNALAVDPPFKRYYFVDLDSNKVDNLREKVKDRQDVEVYGGDCNQVLPQKVFPQVDYSEYRRGLCLLDPYGMHIDWSTVKAAAEKKTIELFINFSIMDINMNVVRDHPDRISLAEIQRMDKCWGDHSWFDLLYAPQPDFFDEAHCHRKATANRALPKAYGERLREDAGFAHVLSPLPMRNSTGAVVYYLYFASHKPVAKGIVSDIFRKWSD